MRQKMALIREVLKVRQDYSHGHMFGTLQSVQKARSYGFLTNLWLRWPNDVWQL